MKLHAEITDRGPLTNQELKVLKLLCEGRLRKEIAALVFRSYGCVSKQIESIAQKLNAHSAAEIVATAVAKGLVKISLQVFLCSITLGSLSSELDLRRPPRQPTVRTVRTIQRDYC